MIFGFLTQTIQNGRKWRQQSYTKCLLAFTASLLRRHYLEECTKEFILKFPVSKDQSAITLTYVSF
jgi:hypothetical protein